jgi:hypothetical protein
VELGGLPIRLCDWENCAICIIPCCVGFSADYALGGHVLRIMLITSLFMLMSVLRPLTLDKVQRVRDILAVLHPMGPFLPKK